MFKLSEYWTRVRCNIMHPLQGKEVRSVYFVFVHTKSLLKDGHSTGLCNLNPLAILRACPLFLHMLRWLNTVLAVCEYLSFAKSWQEKGCSSQLKLGK